MPSCTIPPHTAESKTPKEGAPSWGRRVANRAQSASSPFRDKRPPTCLIPITLAHAGSSFERLHRAGSQR